MITRMEITYRSKEPCSKKPEIFTTGGYEVLTNNLTVSFDFEEMTANCRFEDGYLYIDVLQKNLDKSILDSNGISLEQADMVLRCAQKEDFREIYNECFVDLGEDEPLVLIPMEIEFADYSAGADTSPIRVLGNSFCNLT